jgi:hypothetical protein
MAGGRSDGGMQHLLSRQGKEVIWREDRASLNYGAKDNSCKSKEFLVAFIFRKHDF